MLTPQTLEKILADWPRDAQAAIAAQKSLTGQVKTENDFGEIKIIAGVDVSYNIRDNISRAVVVLMRADELQPIHIARANLPTIFPYVPGLLSFREIPVILKAFEKLPAPPDLLMVDGQGIAHPRRLGIAAHLGVLLDIPAIGVAKSRLTGRHAEPGPNRGDMAPLRDRDEVIGTVLRSKPKTNPLFISPGHRVDMETAVRITVECLRGYRLPEPTRIADKLTKSDPAADTVFK
jgi:deoxyribonuclease V